MNTPSGEVGQADVGSDSFRDNEEPQRQSEDQPARPSDERKLSVSETAENSSSGRLTSPKWLSWIEFPFRVRNPSTDQALKEATGWSMDAASLGCINQAGTFVGAALLRLATADAGCKNPRTCDNTVHGLKPSSLLTISSAIVGIIAAITLPFIGSLVDHTQHRKNLGILSAFVVVAVTGSQICINRDNWLAILILESIGGYFMLVHAMVMFAYLPDLSYVEEDLAHYTSRFNLRQYVVQTSYVAAVVVISEVRDAATPLDGTIQTARQALSIAFGVSFAFMSYAWTFLFRKRLALSQVPEGSNIFTAGFVKVGRTTKKIWSKYRSLKWFMISLLWSPEGGAGAILSITLTFMTIVLGLTPQQIGFVTLCFLSCNIPGSLFAKLICVKFNPLNSYRAALVFFAAIVGATFATLSSPDLKSWVYPFATGWGFATGWVYPSQRVLFCTLIPKGQDTEMMGLFSFSGHIFAWLMPLLFTILNQNGVNVQWSASVICWFVVAADICTIPMGSYRDAVAQVVEKEKFEEDGAVLESGNSSKPQEADQESRIPTERTEEIIESA